MKKILWIPAILILFLVGDRLGAWVLQKLTEKSQFRYSRLYLGEEAADLLLVGNSRGLIFYQPYIEQKTSLSTFNFSYNGLPMNVAATLIRDYYDRYPAPSRMIIDVTMCDRLNDPLLSAFGLYSSYSENMASLVKINSPKSYYAGQLTRLFRYNSEVFQRTLNYLDRSDEDWLTDRVISKAMVQGIYEEPDYQIARDEAGYMQGFNELLEALNQSIQLAESKGTKVVLVVNPYYIPFAQKITNLNEFIGKIEKATGHPVHNYAFSIDKVEAFGDYQHLNKYGSELYIDLLLKDEILP